MECRVISKHLHSDDEILNRFQTYVNSIHNNNHYASIQLLYVCDASYLQNKMSRVRFWVIEELSKHKDINLSITGPGFSNFNETKSLQQNQLIR